ncbi:MAG: DUF4396 domain-containing protein [Alphaproteobacteria bacterium]
MSHHHSHGAHDGVSWKTSAHVTLHCLTGCAIGEVTGLIVGTALGLGVWGTMGLATALAFLFGMGLAVLPVMRQGASFARAFGAVWLGEVISIAVMELAMNGTDYAIGGVQTGSLTAPLFWIGMALAIPAGFLAAWPVNHWLVSKSLKACH